jgi:hypothetical protein
VHQRPLAATATTVQPRNPLPLTLRRCSGERRCDAPAQARRPTWRWSARGCVTTLKLPDTQVVFFDIQAQPMSAPGPARAVLDALARGETVALEQIDGPVRRWLRRRWLVTEDGGLGIPMLGRFLSGLE